MAKKYLRFDEAGDFYTQADVDKMGRVAEILGKHGITSYTYTAASDLDLSKIKHKMAINKSWHDKKPDPYMNEFIAVKEIPSGAKHICPGTKSGKCGVSCFKCMRGTGKTIYIKVHGNYKGRKKY